MTTVVHCRREPYDVYIGRPSKWGNPFKILPGPTGTFVTREDAVAQYREYIQRRPDLLADLHELKDKVLGCWCHPLPCHGDILAELAQ